MIRNQKSNKSIKLFRKTRSKKQRGGEDEEKQEKLNIKLSSAARTGNKKLIQKALDNIMKFTPDAVLDSRGVGKKRRQKAKWKFVKEECDIVIGTHKLLSDELNFMISVFWLLMKNIVLV